jgi:hypothetical protein
MFVLEQVEIAQKNAKTHAAYKNKTAQTQE